MRSSFGDRLLNGIERLGNKLPEPVALFLITGVSSTIMLVVGIPERAGMLSALICRPFDSAAGRAPVAVAVDVLGDPALAAEAAAEFEAEGGK